MIGGYNKKHIQRWSDWRLKVACVGENENLALNLSIRDLLDFKELYVNIFKWQYQYLTDITIAWHLSWW